jgi:hypothetical protein
MTIIKWTLYLILAILGTVVSREVHEMWTPHKTRNHVWTTRGDGKHWERVRSELGEQFLFLTRPSMRHNHETSGDGQTDPTRPGALITGANHSPLGGTD